MLCAFSSKDKKKRANVCSGDTNINSVSRITGTRSPQASEPVVAASGGSERGRWKERDKDRAAERTASHSRKKANHDRKNKKKESRKNTGGTLWACLSPPLRLLFPAKLASTGIREASSPGSGPPRMPLRKALHPYPTPSA